MLGQYLPIVALFVLGVGFAAISLVASRLLAPGRPTPAKLAPYECGVTGDETTNPSRFPVRFFLIAMIFIVFDIEVIFLYPFAMVFRELGTYGLVVIGLFSFAVFESFIYLIGNGALEWGSTKRVINPARASATRTGSGAVLRVGADRPAPEAVGEVDGSIIEVA